MSRLPLNFLHTFKSAAQTENFRATALALSLTHSAVSQQIKLLEQHLGVALFARVKRSVVLTHAGAIFLKGIDRALLEIEAAEAAVRAADQQHGQVIRITVLPSFAQRWLLPRMSRWRDLHPEMPLNIDASLVLADLVRDGYHAGIRVGSGHWNGVIAEPLFPEGCDLIVVGSPEAARRIADQGPAGLLHEPMIGDEPSWRRWFDAAGIKAGRLRPVADFNDLGLMLQAVERDLGIALVREMMAFDALGDGKLVRLSKVTIASEDEQSYYFVYPEALAAWPPLRLLHQWLNSELSLATALALAKTG
jgi:LysR family glycine cleavage system transcriptional activator